MSTTTFTPDDPALPMNYPGFVFRALCNEGHHPEHLLAETGLAANDFENPQFRCAFQSLSRFYLNSLQQTGDPHLGIRLARAFEPNWIGPPAYAAMNAPRFHDALEVLQRFFFLTFPVFELEFPDDEAPREPTEEAIRLRSKLPLGELEYFGSISGLIVCDGLFRAILRSEKVVSRAATKVSAPEGWATVSAGVGFPVSFDAAEDRLWLPRSLLAQPLPGADPINHPRLVNVCEQFAVEASFETTVVNRVVRFLHDQGLDAPIREAARALGYSERSLRRQLDGSGTSYKKLVDQVREGRAKELLASSTLSIQSIADALGFDTPSNFARSFKRWTGATPSAYREQARALVGRK